MEQDDEPLSGEVEADETFIGGKLREGERRALRRRGIQNLGPASKPRSIVFAAVERKGRIRAEVVSTSRGYELREKIGEFVLPGSMVLTDEWSGYDRLEGPARRRRINHSQRIYVEGDVHTQTIEGFFGHFKNDVRGTHHAIPRKWLGSYLNEWVWRWNHRDDDEAMFRQLVSCAAVS